MEVGVRFVIFFYKRRTLPLPLRFSGEEEQGGYGQRLHREGASARLLGWGVLVATAETYPLSGSVLAKHHALGVEFARIRLLLAGDVWND